MRTRPEVTDGGISSQEPHIVNEADRALISFISVSSHLTYPLGSDPHTPVMSWLVFNGHSFHSLSLTLSFQTLTLPHWLVAVFVIQKYFKRITESNDGDWSELEAHRRNWRKMRGHETECHRLIDFDSCPPCIPLLLWIRAPWVKCNCFIIL